MLSNSQQRRARATAAFSTSKGALGSSRMHRHSLHATAVQRWQAGKSTPVLGSSSGCLSGMPSCPDQKFLLLSSLGRSKLPLAFDVSLTFSTAVEVVDVRDETSKQAGPISKDEERRLDGGHAPPVLAECLVQLLPPGTACVFCPINGTFGSEKVVGAKSRRWWPRWTQDEKPAYPLRWRYAVDASAASTSQLCRTATALTRLKARSDAVGESVRRSEASSW